MINNISRFNFSLFVAAFCFGLASQTANAQRINDFALLDLDGKFHQLSYYKDKKAVTFLVIDNSSNLESLENYQNTAKAYNDSFEFYFLIGDSNNSRQSLKNQFQPLKTGLPILFDDGGLVIDLLQITRLGEIIIVDPNRQNILARGAGEAFLQQALTSITENKKPIPAASLEHLKLFPAINNEQENVSYAKDIAPILIENCVNCHRDGGVAPFSMDSWGVVLGWSPMIKEVLMTKRMPPGQIDPEIGHFQNNRAVPKEKLRQLIQWIDEGGMNESDSDPLQEYQATREDWFFGEPDLIVNVPEQIIPATGLIDFLDVEIPITLEEEKWVKATQFIPGDSRVLHHVEGVVLPHNDNASNSNYDNKNSQDTALIAPYVPGFNPLVMPANTGGRIQANDQLALQLHYAAIGREIKDNTRLGFWFYPPDEQPEERLVVACACIAESEWQPIPAYSGRFVAQAELNLETDVYLYNVLPQMHYRGKSIRFDAYLPNETVEALLNIPKYNYNWQIDYQFAEPKFLPAGTRIVATAIYDNSNKNEFNPDASQQVPWGRESYNEILAGIFQWKVAE